MFYSICNSLKFLIASAPNAVVCFSQPLNCACAKPPSSDAGGRVFPWAQWIKNAFSGRLIFEDADENCGNEFAE